MKDVTAQLRELLAQRILVLDGSWTQSQLATRVRGAREFLR